MTPGAAAPQPRRLVVVFFADVVGYSRLMGLDEVGTLATLTKHYEELVYAVIAEYQGRVVKGTGDGLLVEFPSVVNAVTCAVKIQEEMTARNADIPADSRMEFRIGVHLGDVLPMDDDIFGNVVNVAARIESVAKPGGVAVSAAAKDAVGRQLDVAFEDIGEQNLKGIELPVRVFNVTRKRSSPPPPRATGFQVGNIRAEVIVDLLGGGIASYGPGGLGFEYVHSWVPLPDPIEEMRKQWELDAEAEARQRGFELHNGPCVRLDSFRLNVSQAPSGEEVKRPVLSLRPTKWYDYIISNRRLDDIVTVGGVRKSIRNAFASEEELRLRGPGWVKLSNILCITVVLVTSDGWTVFGKRTGHVENHRNELAASVAENMHRYLDEPSDPSDIWSDSKYRLGAKGSDVTWDYQPLGQPNPFFTAQRGIGEEMGSVIGSAVSVDLIRFTNLAWTLDSFNPHLFAVVHHPESIAGVVRGIEECSATSSWEARYEAVPFEPRGDLLRVLRNASWAEVSKGAVMSALVHDFGLDEVRDALR